VGAAIHPSPRLRLEEWCDKHRLALIEEDVPGSAVPSETRTTDSPAWQPPGYGPHHDAETLAAMPPLMGRQSRQRL
jgi:hypothetical protein